MTKISCILLQLAAGLSPTASLYMINQLTVTSLWLSTASLIFHNVEQLASRLKKTFINGVSSQGCENTVQSHFSFVRFFVFLLEPFTIKISEQIRSSLVNALYSLGIRSCPVILGMTDLENLTFQ